MGCVYKMEPINYMGIILLRGGNDLMCEDVLVEHYHDFRADVIITFKDVWAFQRFYKYAVNWIPICPIDHSPISNLIVDKVKTAFKVVSISRFGQKELKSQNVENVYIPHAVDINLYRPLNQREECRKLFNIESDVFCVGIIARNQSRKLIPHQLKGYRRFLDSHKDVKSRLFLWTNVTPSSPSDAIMGVADVGVHLLPEIYRLGLENRVIIPDVQLYLNGLPEWVEGFTRGDMVKLFNSLDVILNCTGGEGAGLPMLEGAACGIIGITTDYAAGPEYVGAGLVVKSEDYVILNTPGTRYALASIDGMAEALTRIYNGDREKMGRKARAFAERLAWPKVLNSYWIPFLEDCEKDLRPKVTASGVEAW